MAEKTQLSCNFAQIHQTNNEYYIPLFSVFRGKCGQFWRKKNRRNKRLIKSVCHKLWTSKFILSKENAGYSTALQHWVHNLTRQQQCSQASLHSSHWHRWLTPRTLHSRASNSFSYRLIFFLFVTSVFSRFLWKMQELLRLDLRTKQNLPAKTVKILKIFS